MSDDDDLLSCHTLCFCAPVVGAFVLIIGVAYIVTDPGILIVPSVKNSTLYVLDLDDKGTSTTMTFNLSTIFSFRNPNSRKVQVREIVAAHSYGGQKLGPDAHLMAPFELRAGKMMTTVPLVVQGRKIVAGSASTGVSKAYAEDAGRGYYTIEAKVQHRGGRFGLTSCRSSCCIYFPAATSERGFFTLFDGEECTTKCVDLY